MSESLELRLQRLRKQFEEQRMPGLVFLITRLEKQREQKKFPPKKLPS